MEEKGQRLLNSQTSENRERLHRKDCMASALPAEVEQVRAGATNVVIEVEKFWVNKFRCLGNRAVSPRNALFFSFHRTSSDSTCGPDPGLLLFL